jgi:hypothetical protein
MSNETSDNLKKIHYKSEDVPLYMYIILGCVFPALKIQAVKCSYTGWHTPV